VRMAMTLSTECSVRSDLVQMAISIQRKMEQRKAAVERSKAILQRYADGSEMSGQDKLDYAAATAEIDRLGEDIELEQAFRAADANRGRGVAEARYGKPLGNGAKFTDLPDARGGNIEDFGRYVRSLITTGFPPREERVATVGVDATGGFLVPVVYGAPILDLVREKMVTAAAGARIVPMDEPSVNIARLDQDPVPGWRNEGAPIAESDAVFGQVQLRAKSLAVHSKVSLELLEDSPQNFGEVLADSFARAFAIELDRVALYGSGVAPQPRGMKNTANVVIINFVGGNGGQLTAANASALTQTVARLRTKNYSPSGVVYSERTAAQMAGLQNAANEPIELPEYFRSAGKHISSGMIPNNLTVGTSNDTSDLIAGDFGHLLVGLRTSFSLMALREPLMLSNGYIALVGWARADVAVSRAAAFEILAGLRA
jgi:HK97 family phage major capsid protein